MTRATKKRSGKDLPVEAMTLAAMLAALDRPGKLSATRLRDLRSAVKRVANLLGDEPAALPLDIAGISARLNTINPLAAGMTAKRLANIRSDFLAAAKVCGVQPVTGRKSLSPEWAKLFKRLSGRRTHIGLSRLARYASARGIRPCDINDDVIVGFIAAVRNGSLHREPNRLHRQVTLIWNEAAARAPGLGLQTGNSRILPRPAQAGRLGRFCRPRSGKTLTTICLGVPGPIHLRPTLVRGLWRRRPCDCAAIKSMPPRPL